MSFHGQLVAGIRSSGPSISFTASMASEKLADIDQLFDSNPDNIFLEESELRGSPIPDDNDSNDLQVEKNTRGIVSFTEAEMQSIGFVPGNAPPKTFRLGATSENTINISQWAPINNAAVAACPPAPDEDAAKEDSAEKGPEEDVVETETPTQESPSEVEMSEKADPSSEHPESDPESKPDNGIVFSALMTDSAPMEEYYECIRKDIQSRNKNIKKKQQTNSKKAAPFTPRRRPIRKDVPQMATIGGVEIDLSEHELRSGTVGLIRSLVSGPDGSGPNPIEVRPKGNKKRITDNKEKIDPPASISIHPDPAFTSTCASGSEGEAAEASSSSTDESLASPTKGKRKSTSNPNKSPSSRKAKKRKTAQPEEQDAEVPESDVPNSSIETQDLAPTDLAPEGTQNQVDSFTTVRNPTPQEYKERSPETALHIAGVNTHDFAYPGPYPNGGKPHPSSTPETEAQESITAATEVIVSAPGLDAANSPSKHEPSTSIPKTQKRKAATKKQPKDTTGATPKTTTKRKKNSKADNEVATSTPAAKKRKTAKTVKTAQAPSPSPSPAPASKGDIANSSSDGNSNSESDVPLAQTKTQKKQSAAAQAKTSSPSGKTATPTTATKRKRNPPKKKNDDEDQDVSAPAPKKRGTAAKTANLQVDPATHSPDDGNSESDDLLAETQTQKKTSTPASVKATPTTAVKRKRNPPKNKNGDDDDDRDVSTPAPKRRRGANWEGRR